MITLDLQTLPARDRYRWLISSIIPRPIAFVSTISPAGIHNLAPFSYFNGVSSRPPVISIAIGVKRDGTPKDSLRNIESNGELVVNIVNETIARPMVLTSGEYPYEESEFDLSGLTPVPSTVVAPPRVEECPIQMECRLVQVVRVGADPIGLVLAEVIVMHVGEEVITDGLIDPRKLNPVSRLGGNMYATLGELFEIARPK
jgi:flavin reductase (DIM6/NTAB) family NADH-FMN oxidoreductase RutF